MERRCWGWSRGAGCGGEGCRQGCLLPDVGELMHLEPSWASLLPFPSPSCSPPFPFPPHPIQLPRLRTVPGGEIPGTAAPSHPGCIPQHHTMHLYVFPLPGAHGSGGAPKNPHKVPYVPLPWPSLSLGGFLTFWLCPLIRGSVAEDCIPKIHFYGVVGADGAEKGHPNVPSAPWVGGILR